MYYVLNRVKRVREAGVKERERERREIDWRMSKH
jgi:hypothetical protein